MSDENKNVTNSEIVALYKAGYSQKDIIQKHNLTAKNLRAILQAEGLETHRFRALDESVTKIILQLIKNGARFKDVEEICDISFHATREVVARHNLQRASRRARNSKEALVLPDEYKRNAEFLERYLAGESFCALSKVFHLSDEEIVYEFLSINEKQAKQHRKNLKQKVLEDASKSFSTTAIARKHTVSTAIVRQILNEANHKKP